jgi:predicted nuclease of predicted toxin-antitoxin system
MRLLLDANLSPRIAESLRAAGFEAVHVADIELVSATDDQILDRAAEDDFVVATADSDFGVLLAMRRAMSPSVVYLRHVVELMPEQHLGLLVANLPLVAADLERGAIVSLSPNRLAVRELPIQ